jgi:hypothetical protein
MQPGPHPRVSAQQHVGIGPAIYSHLFTAYFIKPRGDVFSERFFWARVLTLFLLMAESLEQSPDPKLILISVHSLRARTLPCDFKNSCWCELLPKHASKVKRQSGRNAYKLMSCR